MPKLGTGYICEASLAFYLDGFTTKTFPVDVHEGGEIVKDVALVTM